MTRGNRKPDFFIVGAPKCGTTALHLHLRQHPDVFMPAEKEHNHFATDLLPATDPYRDRDHYLKLFAAAREEKRVGEASVFHLYSAVAAENIHEFDAAAKIVVMLRDPVSWMPSYHSQMVYNGDENVAELEDALAAESERRRGVGIPSGLRFAERLLYREMARFAEQVTRYFDRFGRDAVHVILQDEYAQNSRAIFRQTLEFLEVDPDFEPEFEIATVRCRRSMPAPCHRSTSGRHADRRSAPPQIDAYECGCDRASGSPLRGATRPRGSAAGSRLPSDRRSERPPAQLPRLPGGS